MRFKKDVITLIFAVGINDSLFYNSEKRFKVAPEEFSQNIKKIIKISQKYTPNVWFIGLTPVDESKVDPIPWYPKGSYKNEFIKKYNELLRDLCWEEKIAFIDLLEEIKSEDFKANLIDGIHPNTNGHAIIWSIIKSNLFKEE